MPTFNTGFIYSMVVLLLLLWTVVMAANTRARGMH